MKILPWAAVVNGPTGAMPQDFWTKIGAVATTVANTLVYVGQLVYKGLVALGTFLVNLAEAIADWGMKAVGAVWNAAVSVAQTVARVMQEAVEWVIRFAIDIAKAAMDPLLALLRGLVNGWASGAVSAAASSFAEFALTGRQAQSTLTQMTASFLLPTAVLAGAIAIGLFAVGTALGPFGYLAAAAAGIVAGVVIASLVSGTAGDSRQAPTPPSADQSVMQALAVNTVAQTLPSQSQPDDLRLDTTMDWVWVVLPAVLAVVTGAAATGVPDVLEYVSLALIVPTVMISLFTDAALRFSGDQALVNRVVYLYEGIAVLGLIFDGAALIWGIYTKSPGGALLAAVGIAMGAYAWWAADQYLRNHPLR